MLFNTTKSNERLLGLSFLWRCGLVCLFFHPLGIAQADTIVSTNTTQTGGTYTVSPAGALVVTHPTNDPLLTLTSGATSAGVEAVVLGSLANEEGRLVINGGSTLNTSGDFATTRTYGAEIIHFGSAFLGLNSNSTGTATVSGTGSKWQIFDNLLLGTRGTGNLRIENGGLVTNTGTSIGGLPTATGTATVTGAGSLWQTSLEFSVGSFGSGTLNIENGGQVINTLSGHIGYWYGGSSTANVTGSGSKWQIAGDLIVSGRDLTRGGGTAALNILDNGLVSVEGTTKSWYLGTVTLDGGTLSTGSFDRTQGTFNHHQGTLRINGGTYTQTSGNLILSGKDALETASFELLAGATTSGIQTLTLGNDASRFGTVLVSGGSTLSSSGTSTLAAAELSTGTAQVTGAGSSWQNTGGMLIGSRGTADLTIANGGLVSNTTAQIGANETGSGKVSVTGVNSQWQNSSSLSVGELGHGELRIEAGGLVTNYDANVAFKTGSTGAVTVTGAGSEWRNAEMLVVGHSGNGSLDILDGGLVSDLSGHVGGWFGTESSAKISGAGSEWRNENTLFVGYSDAKGTLLIENGGLTNGSFGYVGYGTGSTGIATVTGAGSKWVTTSVFNVGTFGTGTLNIEDSGLVSAGFNITIADRAAAIGTINVADQNSKLQTTNDLRLGYRGQGELNINAGGLVTNVSAELGTMAFSKGTATVTGAGAKWQNSGSMYVGGNATAAGGTGILTVNNGGTVEVADTLKLWSAGTLHLQTGGTIKTDDFDFSAGTFNFTGGTLTATGNVTGNVVVPNGGMVTGTGLFSSLSIADGGAVSPGFSPETISAGTGAWAAGGTYIWEINALNADGGTAGDATGWDLLNYTSSLSITALSGDPFLIELHSLDTSDASGLLANFDAGNSYSWLIATAANGAFSNTSGLSIDDDLFLNSLTGGEFNLQGQNGGTELFLTFTPFSEPIPTNSAIPEPATGLLLLLGTLLLKSRRRCAR